jgi:hypothetical protein
MPGFRGVAVLVVAAVSVVGAACGTGEGPDAAPATTRPAETTTVDPTPASTASTVAPAAGEQVDLRLITVNLLHGLELPGSCAPGLDQCDAPTRLAMLWSQIEGAGCPDVVALQEVSPRQQELVPATIADLCGGRYTLVREDLGPPDQEMILTSLPVLEEGFVDLSGPPWTAHWARLGTPVGPVDVFATHYASNSFNPPCGPDPAAIDGCADVCPVGLLMGDCNAVETLAFLDERFGDDGARIQLVVGDLNKPLGDPRIATLTDAGFVDVWLLAGNPECDPATGVGCTCCVGGDGRYDGLEVRDHVLSSRIDFVLVRVADCELVADSPTDADGDGTATGLFATGPVDEPVAGPNWSPVDGEGLWWSSDHQGVQADLTFTCA